MITLLYLLCALIALGAISLACECYSLKNPKKELETIIEEFKTKFEHDHRKLIDEDIPKLVSDYINAKLKNIDLRIKDKYDEAKTEIQEKFKAIKADYLKKLKTDIDAAVLKTLDQGNDIVKKIDERVHALDNAQERYEKKKTAAENKWEEKKLLSYYTFADLEKCLASWNNLQSFFNSSPNHELTSWEISKEFKWIKFRYKYKNGHDADIPFDKLILK